MRRLDITDIQFGGLIPKKCYPGYKGSKTYWDCYCTVCKQQKIMPLDTIRKKPISCGCVREDLTGKEFGYLKVTAMFPLEDKVECVCQKCGRIEKHGVYYIKMMTQCSECTKLETGTKISKALSESDLYQSGTYLAAWESGRKKNSNNTSGYRGVSYDKARNKWRAYIKYRRKDILIGRFDTIEEAILARNIVEDDIKLRLTEKHEILSGDHDVIEKTKSEK